MGTTRATGLSNKVWALAVNTRNRLKHAGVLGPLDGLTTYLGPRLLPPPSTDVHVKLPLELELTVPPRSPSYRNFATNLYETDVTELVRSLLQPGMTVVDLGANIGYYTLLASRLVGAEGRVHAFEPDRESFMYLERNLQANGCTNSVAVNKAVRDADEVVGFIRPGHERGYVSAPASNSTTVEAITLDSYFRQLGWPRVDVIKIDIEGSEEKALLGMRELVNRNAKVHIIMELNSNAVQRAGTTLPHLVSTLSGLGFSSAYVIELKRLLPLTKLLPGSRAVHNLLLTAPTV